MALKSSLSRESYRNFQSKIFALVLVILFFWITIEYAHLLYRRYQIESKKLWFIEENERLSSKNRELEKQYEYYKTDYFFRKEAKRKLNKKEPGERVLIVTERPDSSLERTLQKTSPTKDGESSFSEEGGTCSDTPCRNWKTLLFGE